MTFLFQLLAAAFVFIVGLLVLPDPRAWQRWPDWARVEYWRDKSFILRAKLRLTTWRSSYLFYAVVAVVLLVFVVWAGPSLLTQAPRLGTPAERHKAIADTRTSLVALVVALGAVGGLAYTARTFRLAQQNRWWESLSWIYERATHPVLEQRLSPSLALLLLSGLTEEAQTPVQLDLASGLVEGLFRVENEVGPVQSRERGAE